MPRLAARQILRMHAAPFAIAFLALTAAFLALPSLRAPGAPPPNLLETLALSVPFVAALTVPMAVFIAVLFVFTRLGKSGTLDIVRGEPGGLLRLVAPVIGAAAVVAVFMTVCDTQVLPWANTRLVATRTGITRAEAAKSDRAMTVGALRSAARDARASASPQAPMRAARFDIEIHKKFALGAACVFLALLAAAIGVGVPRGGLPLVIGASLAVFGAYYGIIITGETMAQRLTMPPVVGMWLANVVMLAVAAPILWWRRGPNAPRAVVVGGPVSGAPEGEVPGQLSRVMV